MIHLEKQLLALSHGSQTVYVQASLNVVREKDFQER